MWLLRKRLSLISEKNNLQTAQEWTKSYIELIASRVHPNTGNHLRSHLRAIMAFDHRRLIRPRKKSGRIFCVRQVNFAKSCQQIWVRINQPFIPFIHHIWGETVLWGTFFIIQTLDRKQYFTILQCKLHSFSSTDDGSTRWLLTKPLKNFQNHLYGHPVLTFVVRAEVRVWMNINRVTLQHDKEFVMFIFYFKMV